MTGNGWKQLKGWKWLDWFNGRKWLEMAGDGWNRLEMDIVSRMVGNGCK